ncbi:hypothetical protein HanXRQr2_Chr12g0534961 [Helianthus annuus]|uniref:Uncharacterized protein n=2 Tax=Helianthus annuus TaxID=4232 RepID=A0A251SV11_HELAN|nr:hypothetical protein HanXRQr2_Chr12g0534961 [Helianthus annuus]KAJ0862194.1 hypothetical protein HanPSC8_Chr12g0515301 [Helianthus annuus]
MTQSEFQATGGDSFKDADSYTGDNTTPVSKDYVSDLKQPSSDMKRNLDDVYLNDEGVGSSASKPRMCVEKKAVDEDLSNN